MVMGCAALHPSYAGSTHPTLAPPILRWLHPSYAGYVTEASCPSGNRWSWTGSPPRGCSGQPHARPADCRPKYV